MYYNFLCASSVFASFLCFVSLSFALLQLVEKYCIFGRFFGRFARFLAVCVCLSVSTQKAVILAAFAPQFFDAPPTPKRPPPRPRLPFRKFFFKIFSFRPQPSVCQPSIFFENFFFPPYHSCQFYFFIFFSSAAYLCFIWLPTHNPPVMLFIFLNMSRVFIWLLFDVTRLSFES